MAAPLWRTVLRRMDRGDWADWAVPALVAALWATLLRVTDPAALGLRQTLVALGGPTVLLAGLHARCFGYLHAPHRERALVLPIPGAEHFAAARRQHRRAWWRSFAVGTVALGLALGTDLRTPTGLGLLADWCVFVVIAMGVEPWIPAVGAALGRRFPQGSPITALQRSMGGGWTLPEAVIHLYAPALGLGVAMALALPGQLAIDRFAQGLSVPQGLVIAALLGVLLGTLATPLAPHLYARGVFQAVPFLSEAQKTLAGPAVPEPSPVWLRALPTPGLRLWALQFVRLTPVPTLRLLLLVVAVPLAWKSPSLPLGLALVGAASLLWLLPARAVARLRPARRRWLAALPVAPALREGRNPAAQALLGLPVALALLVALAGWIRP